MTLNKYQRYEAEHNRRTMPARHSEKRWTAAEEKILLARWGSSSDERIWVARSLGRTYVACMKRHARLVRDGDDQAPPG